MKTFLTIMNKYLGKQTTGNLLLYSLFVSFLTIQACCYSDEPPNQTKYELTRFLALKDTNDIIEEIRYNQSPLILFPDSDISNFPLSENINTSAYIKRKSRVAFDTIEFSVQLYLQHSTSTCKDDEIYRREPKLTIASHTMNKITIKMKEDDFHDKLAEIYTIE